MKSNLTRSLLLSSIALSLLIANPVFAQSNIDIQSSITNLTGQVRNIGLLLLGASLGVGSVLMGFGNQLGGKIVSSAIIGAVILLSATSIIELVRTNVR